MLNRVTLLGRLEKKEYRQAKNGSYYCKLSIKTTRKYIDSHAKTKELINFHHVYFYGNLATITQNNAILGEFIYVEGELNNKTISSQGNQITIQIITGDNVQFIPSGRKQSSSRSEFPTSTKNNTISEKDAFGVKAQGVYATDYKDSIDF